MAKKRIREKDLEKEIERLKAELRKERERAKKEITFYRDYRKFEKQLIQLRKDGLSWRNAGKRMGIGYEKIKYLREKIKEDHPKVERYLNIRSAKKRKEAFEEIDKRYRKKIGIKDEREPIPIPDKS